MGGAAGLALVPTPVVAAFDPASWPVGGYYTVSYTAKYNGAWGFVQAVYSASGELLKVRVDGELVEVTQAPWLLTIKDAKLVYDFHRPKVLGDHGKYYDVFDDGFTLGSR